MLKEKISKKKKKKSMSYMLIHLKHNKQIAYK